MTVPAVGLQDRSELSLSPLLNIRKVRIASSFDGLYQACRKLCGRGERRKRLRCWISSQGSKAGLMCGENRGIGSFFWATDLILRRGVGRSLVWSAHLGHVGSWGEGWQRFYLYLQ